MGVTVDTDKVIASLAAKSLRGKKKARLDVGYEAPYAVYVHEDLTANHPNGGQAKFLEAAVRGNRREMAAIVRRSIQAKNGLEEGLLRSGHFLMSRSRPLVPVDTGFLRDSGYVRVVAE